MKRILLAGLVALFGAGLVYGREVLSDDAQRAVETWFQMGRPMGCSGLSSDNMAAVRTYEGRDGVGKFHVFSFAKEDGSGTLLMVVDPDGTEHVVEGRFVIPDELLRR